MKTAVKVLLAIAGSALIVGLAVGLCGLFMLDFDFDAMQTQNYEDVTHEVSGEFSDISIETIESSIEFRHSDDGTCYVDCMESEYVTYSVSVQEGELKITANDTRQWYHNIDIFNTQRQNMTVYLPLEAYESLRIKSATGAVRVTPEFSFADVDIDLNTGMVSWEANVAHSMKIKNRTGFVQIKNVTPDGMLLVENDTGRVSIEGVTAQGIKAETSTGKVIMTNTIAKESIRVKTSTGNAEFDACRAESLSAQARTGKVKLSDVVVTGLLQVETSTGDVEITACDAGQVDIETDTGDVEGTFQSPKEVFAESDTGRIRVPKSTTGGRCDIVTDTGDIIIEFEE